MIAGGDAAAAVAQTAAASSGAARALFLQAVERHPARFFVRPGTAGFELAVAEPANVPAGRSFAKVCSVRPDHTLVYFFKRSLLPFSRDRLGYGGVEWRDDQLDEEQIRAGLDFLCSGLSPSARPPWLRRALPYDVPE
jgi:hypothetical protein